MKIKTLAEILAESETDSASTPISQAKTGTQKYLSKKTVNIKQLPFKPKYSKTNPRPSTSEDEKASQIVDDFDSTTSFFSTEHSSKPSKTRSKRRKKRFHPAANFEPESWFLNNQNLVLIR